MDLQSIIPQKETIEQILARDVKELPTLPVVAIKLLEITMDEESSAADLAKVVQTDPAIAIKVLKIVNSAAYGFRRKISSVSQAVTLLGFSTIRILAMGVSLFEHLVKADHEGNFDRTFFWQHCLSVAGLGLALAEELDYPDPEEAYIAGLLHDIGKIIVDICGTIRYSDFIKNFTKSEGLMWEEEQKLIGVGHDELGAYFSNTWDMPDNLVLAIMFHHRRFDHLDLSEKDTQLIAIVAMANFISWTQGLGSIKLIHHPILQPEIEKLIDINKINFEHLVSRMQQVIQSTAEFYNFNFPTDEQFSQNLLRANIELGRINTKIYYLYENLKQEVLVQSKHNQPVHETDISPKQIIANTLDTIHQEFKFDRLYVMKIDKASRSLVTLSSMDTSTVGMDLSALEIEIKPDAGGFIDCLRKHIPVIIKGKTSGEKKVLDFLQVNEIGIVPLSNQTQIIGVLGMDNAFSDHRIDPESLTKVAIIANELGMVLDNIKTIDDLNFKTSIDSITNVLSQKTIEKRLNEAFKQSQQQDTKLSIALLSVDSFKWFTETFGRLASDRVLKLIANTIKRFTRPKDFVGRYGSEKFIVVLNSTNSTDAVHYSERIRMEIEDLGKLLTKRFAGHPLTLSIGVTSYNPTMKDHVDMIDQAAQALQMAEEGGRNMVRLVTTIY